MAGPRAEIGGKSELSDFLPEFSSSIRLTINPINLPVYRIYICIIGIIYIKLFLSDSIFTKWTENTFSATFYGKTPDSRQNRNFFGVFVEVAQKCKRKCRFLCAKCQLLFFVPSAKMSTDSETETQNPIFQFPVNCTLIISYVPISL